MNGAAGKMSRCSRYRPAAPAFYVRNTRKAQLRKKQSCAFCIVIFIWPMYI